MHVTSHNLQRMRKITVDLRQAALRMRELLPQHLSSLTKSLQARHATKAQRQALQSEAYLKYLKELNAAEHAARQSRIQHEILVMRLKAHRSQG